MRNQVALALIVSATIPAVLSVALHLRTPWRESEMGRHLLAYSSAIAAVLLLSLIYRLGPWPLWFEWVRLAAFGSIPIVLWWRCLIQLKALRRH